jgi:hypothetical protein
MLINIVKFFDAFGKPVSLNFRGNEKYKTIPGALFTAAAVWLVVSFAIFRSDFYKNIPLTWSVSEHNTLLKGSEINEYIDINNLNLSLKVEIVSYAL